MGETEKKNMGTRDLKKNTQKKNENDNNSTGIEDLALVRGLNGRFGCGGENKKR